MTLLLAALIAGFPQSNVETLCAIVSHRQEYRHERDTWEKIWIYLSIGGADLSEQGKREIMAFCKARKVKSSEHIPMIQTNPGTVREIMSRFDWTVIRDTDPETGRDRVAA